MPGFFMPFIEIMVPGSPKHLSTFEVAVGWLRWAIRDHLIQTSMRSNA